MDVRKVALLVGALLIAAVTAILARNLMTGGAAPQAAAAAVPEQGPQVLVATKPLPIGTILEANSFAFQPWPQDMVEKAYFLKGQVDPATLVGKVVRYSIPAGQPVTQGALVGPGERGFLAAALAPGMRAITVSINATSGVAGFVFPGDRVDLMLTQEVEGGGDGPSLKVSETVVRNLRVLAVDQRTSDEEKKEAKVGSTLTLEVTPKLAEKIAVAQTIGQLSVSLRSIADNAAEIERAIAAGEIEVGDDQDAMGDKAMEMALALRPSDAAPTFTVGAEVSRYQRATVPARPQSDAPSGNGSSSGSSASPARPTGPVVRIARGNEVSVVAVGVN